MLKKILVVPALSLCFIFILALYVQATPGVRLRLTHDREPAPWPGLILAHGESITVTATVYIDGYAVPYENIRWNASVLVEGDTFVYHGNVATLTIGHAETRYRNIGIMASTMIAPPRHGTSLRVRILETGPYADKIRISRISLDEPRANYLIPGETYTFTAYVFGNTPCDRSAEILLPDELVDWEIMVMHHDMSPIALRESGDVFEFYGNTATLTVGRYLPYRAIVILVNSRTHPEWLRSASVFLPAPESAAPADRVMRFQIGSTIFTDGGAERSLAAAPFIKEDRTMVPLRVVGEAFGAEFYFYRGEITITLNDTTLYMTIGEPLPYNMGTPVIVADHTFVPIAYIIGQMGGETRWDGDSHAVYIYIAQ